MDWFKHPRIQRAAHAVAAGEVIAYPTEAVWGLGCDPFNPEAVDWLLAMKQRPMHKGLIVVAASLAQLTPYLPHLSHDQRQQLTRAWPGPVTFLVPNQGGFPPWITGSHASVAVRVSAHPVVQGLCRAWGGPLVSTSANPSGKAPARNRLTVARYFYRQLGAVAPGTTQTLAKPTEIRDLLTGQVHRAG